MRRLAIGLLAVCAVALVVSITASAAQAQCSNGACGFGARGAGPGRAVIRTTVRFGGRLGGQVGGRLRSTRLFDGDGRPFRRAG
jgi:hypothetical protein